MLLQCLYKTPRSNIKHLIVRAQLISFAEFEQSQSLFTQRKLASLQIVSFLCYNTMQLVHIFRVDFLLFNTATVSQEKYVRIKHLFSGITLKLAVHFYCILHH